MSDVTTAFGTQLFLNVAGTLERVAEIDDLPELPSLTTALYDTSSFDTVDVREWKKQPLKDGATFTIAGNYVLGSNSAEQLEAADASEVAVPYRIVMKQGADTFEVAGSALFYDLRFLTPGDSKRRFNITMKPTTKASPAEVTNP
ncbi:hypothetical protein [Novosphingobium guangzhouense]|uniref:Phage tail protein n=1 Tax=Novosphingobium guangzhouense TaxID=1850347 RepID=A0A2K2FUQ0_9SPHN|nr:hypothetical protein [Novosphingobium guangzhouense]PNU02517.1 hypothetical protein A8V01_09055 [Novosphingobium guangzhouense]